MDQLYTIDECQPADFPDVLNLLWQLWPTKAINPVAVRNVFDHALASEAQVYRCARVAGRLVGFGSLTIKNNLWQEGYLGHIDELVVDQHYRKKGIGKSLLQSLTEVAQLRNCRCIELDSAFHRKEAHAFYEAHGFENRAFLFSKTL